MSRQERAKEMRTAVSLAAQGATDAQAATMPTLYGLWAPGAAYGGGGQPSTVRRPAITMAPFVVSRKNFRSAFRAMGWVPSFPMPQSS